MRIVFMGTSLFALAALKKLIDEKYNISAVYTKVPKPKGRGHQIEKSPVHEYAEAQGLIIETPKTLKTEEALMQLSSYKPDIIIVAAYGLILPQPVLSLPPKGCINIHGSLLPRWRGAAPIERAIMAGDKVTGITIMQMDDGVDTGNMLLKEELAIGDNENFEHLFERMKSLGALMITNTLEKINEIKPIPQPEEGVTYAKKIEPQDYILNIKDSMKVNYRKTLALKGSKFFYREKDFLIIHEAYRSEFKSLSHEVMIVSDKKLYIRCSDGFLEVIKVQRPSKNIALASEFIKGFRSN